MKRWWVIYFMFFGSYCAAVLVATFADTPIGWQKWTVLGWYGFATLLIMVLVVGVFYRPLGEWLAGKW
jgi:hypothetical protein